MNRERLLQLRRVVEAAPDDRFHMRSFSEEAPCGTAYCAVGWAAVDPWFREHTEIGDTLILHMDGSLSPRALFPESRLADLFGIDEEEAECLFALNHPRGRRFRYLDPHVVSREMVLASIDRLLAGQPIEHYPIPAGD